MNIKWKHKSAQYLNFLFSDITKEVDIAQWSKETIFFFNVEIFLPYWSCISQKVLLANQLLFLVKRKFLLFLKTRINLRNSFLTDKGEKWQWIILFLIYSHCLTSILNTNARCHSNVQDVTQVYKHTEFLSLVEDTEKPFMLCHMLWLDRTCQHRRIILKIKIQLN